MANIVETAANAGSFKTLLTLVEAAGLLELLESPGPYTVFAPTDEAFEKLPANKIASWMEDLPTLKKIVSYHVLFGDVRTDNFVELNSAETVEGSVVGIDQTGDGFKVNDAKILQTDILTDNGVIHVIDAVISPALVAAK
ncbi:fasciclin domain-containing protein [Ancylothrix sp. C2]|uniref:fasciclin domain-containing protein n=1 Tax=Ancylothrix sp. D3o TaxID=2953691 RepID=UPI0021BB67A5|nr:fasciclin domain-containing protein [Ancylothrix sp. D3o]MCT7951883.1 fasciclin domain-containing protein [Ancylothrix sp. D3o]